MMPSIMPVMARRDAHDLNPLISSQSPLDTLYELSLLLEQWGYMLTAALEGRRQDDIPDISMTTLYLCQVMSRALRYEAEQGLA